MPNTYAVATLALQALAGAGFRNVYVQRGDASGDIPHVLSALAVKATYGVLVVDGTDTGTKGSRMADSYHTGNHIAQNRIAYVKDALLTVSNAVNAVPARAGGARTWELTQSTKDAVAALLSSNKEPAKGSRVAIREVLSAAANMMSPAPRTISMKTMRRCVSFWPTGRFRSIKM
jgi:hypothetical protein